MTVIAWMAVLKTFRLDDVNNAVIDLASGQPPLDYPPNPSQVVGRVKEIIRARAKNLDLERKLISDNSQKLWDGKTINAFTAYQYEHVLGLGRWKGRIVDSETGEILKEADADFNSSSAIQGVIGKAKERYKATLQ